MTRRRALLMNQRNDSTKRDLVKAINNNQENKVKDIKIFCVGNELYGNPPHRLAEEYRNLSGVRELRSYCRSVPAEGRMDSALVFIEEQVPALLDSIRQWTLTGRDSVTPARAPELRSALEQVEQILRQVCLITCCSIQKSRCLCELTMSRALLRAGGTSLSCRVNCTLNLILKSCISFVSSFQLLLSSVSVSLICW